MEKEYHREREKRWGGIIEEQIIEKLEDIMDILAKLEIPKKEAKLRIKEALESVAMEE